MRSMGLQGRSKRHRVTAISHAHHKFPHLLRENFQGEKPNTIWCSDITAIPQKEGSYLASFARLEAEEVGKRYLQALTITSLKKAITRRKPSSDSFHHSHQGLPYGYPEGIWISG